jgi:hypothetical protein
MIILARLLRATAISRRLSGIEMDPTVRWTLGRREEIDDGWDRQSDSRANGLPSADSMVIRTITK